MSFRVFARRAIAATACAGVGAAAYPFVSAPFPRALNEESNASPRERLVVLGSGWGAVALLKNIDPTLYDVSVVSPRNFLAFLAGSPTSKAHGPNLCGASRGSTVPSAFTSPRSVHEHAPGAGFG